MSFAKWVAVFLVISLAGLSGRARRASRMVSEPEPRTIRITEIKVTETDVYAEYPGRIFAKDKVGVRARVPGHIEQKLFRPGQEVKAGQPLYILDLRPLKAHLQQTEGTLKQAVADLALAQRQVPLREAEAKLAVAHIDLIRATQNHAAAEVERARFSTEHQIQSAQGRVEAQSGARDAAALNASDGIVRAPVRGRVGDSAAQIGSLVDPNAPRPLTTICPFDPIWVRFHVGEAQYLSFAEKNGGPTDGGSQVQLVLADNSVYPDTGHVANSLKQVETGTGAIELQAEFPSPRHWLARTVRPRPVSYRAPRSRHSCAATFRAPGDPES